VINTLDISPRWGIPPHPSKGCRALYVFALLAASIRFLRLGEIWGNRTLGRIRSTKGGSMDPFIGEIRMVGFNFAPNGWALCNGQLLPITQNQALFSLLGTYFGGDGVRTFGLPNLQSRVPIHQGQGQGLSPYAMGQIGGTENVALLQTQMPMHNHLVSVNNAVGAASDPTNAILAKGYTGESRNPTFVPNYTSAAATGTLAANAVSQVGGNQPHANIQPYQCVNFIIALQGVFPSRS
jgi:microcystin-dependent protein